MKLLLTGDSIIARHEGLTIPHINSDLQKLIPQCELINTAVSGINSGGLFASLPDLVFKQEKCDYLIILIGTNDLALHKQVPLKQFKNNIELIASGIIWLYYPHQVIFISPPAVDENKQHVRNNALINKYSQIIEQITKEYNFSYLNLIQTMIKTGNLSELCRGIKNDGLHFGEKGYQLLSNLISNKLAELQHDNA
ncbi:lysophospholipase L1-like esterase [Lactobacillus colini]|uniref:Lysophospholipase L1-like esterase n=1 Tax=Lactobacillus colini TaxID=1819254 RepID=A0ABS4MGT6_9LACO|nr:SGNH/GDSL hydrolase family protein [Lactobacillus colini]MBP2058914.1 lysophospholipase L1-like esterase [Lactobacillus colini]